MRKTLITLVALGMFGAGAAQAQTTVTGDPARDAKPSTQSQGQEAVTRPNTDMMDKNNPGSTGTVATNVKLEPGANSFTEAQARSRMEQAGFKDVKELKKDDQGIWRGQAMQSGNTVMVGLDFKGNVSTAR